MNTLAALSINDKDWAQRVVDGATRMGIAVTRGQASQFALHGQWLIQWNRKINLTAITDPAQMAEKHFLDAIAPLPYLPAHGNLLDIGTGGGFPGLPLKIMLPGLSMTLIDGVRKKISFVKHVIRQLALQDIDALHTRAENLSRHPAYQHYFHAIVTRAVAEMDTIIALALPLLRPGGKIILYQGPLRVPGPVSEKNPTYIRYKESQLRVCTTSYQLPFAGGRRALTILESS